MNRLEPLQITKTQLLYKTLDGQRVTTTYETTLRFFQTCGGNYCSSYINFHDYPKTTSYKSREAWEAAHARYAKKYTKQ